MRSMPPKKRSSRAGRVASTIASDISAKDPRPVSVSACSRTAQGLPGALATAPVADSISKPQARPTRAMKADRKRFMIRSLLQSSSK